MLGLFGLSCFLFVVCFGFWFLVFAVVVVLDMFVGFVLFVLVNLFCFYFPLGLCSFGLLCGVVLVVAGFEFRWDVSCLVLAVVFLFLVGLLSWLLILLCCFAGCFYFGCVWVGL